MTQTSPHIPQFRIGQGYDVHAGPTPPRLGAAPHRTRRSYGVRLALVDRDRAHRLFQADDAAAILLQADPRIAYLPLAAFTT